MTAGGMISCVYIPQLVWLACLQQPGSGLHPHPQPVFMIMGVHSSGGQLIHTCHTIMDNGITMPKGDASIVILKWTKDSSSQIGERLHHPKRA